MRLEEWSYSPETLVFTGKIYGHRNFADGSKIKIRTQYVDWNRDQSSFMCGGVKVILGNNGDWPADRPDPDDIPF